MALSYYDERTRLMDQMEAQRKAAILKRLSGASNPSEKIKQNQIAGSTAKVLSILAGAGIGGSLAYYRNGRGGGHAFMGALLGGATGALISAVAKGIGSLSGSMTETDHKDAMKSYADIGIGRYMVPGAAEYYDAKLDNALIDTEKGVKRPEQMVI